MARVVHNTRLYAFGSASDLEALHKCVAEICDDGKEIAGISHDDFENGIEIENKITVSNWTCICFWHYTIRDVSLKETFQEFINLFPDLVFICAGTYDCSLSHTTFGNTWFVGVRGKIINCGNDEITLEDIEGYDEDNDDTDYEEIIWNEEIPKMFAANFSAWLDKRGIVKRIGDAGKDETFLSGLAGIIRNGV